MAEASSTLAHEAGRPMLRHAVATLAYRGAKALRGAPEGFAEFRIAAETRTPGQILAHIGDLLDWALNLSTGKQEWHASPDVPWNQGVERFFAALKALDDSLASSRPLAVPADNLFQGPIADALTHVGQITMLRRLAGSPVRAENYFKAAIAAGRVGADQQAPLREFD